MFFENWDIIEKIMSLKEKMKVYYVAGNHDFHVLKLQDHSYPFSFKKDLSLHDEDYTYSFLHGYEFEPDQQELFSEALCRVMSDGAGSFESGIWATLTRDWSDLKYFLSTLTKKRRIRKDMENLQLKPEERMKDTMQEIEKNAYSKVRPREILVFGHTHRPFINKSENVANCGSWVKDSAIYNTFVELSRGKPRLFVFDRGKKKEIEERE